MKFILSFIFLFISIFTSFNSKVVLSDIKKETYESISYNLKSNNDNPNFTNLIIFAKFQDEDEFVTYDKNNKVLEVINNSYNKSKYSIKEYVKSITNNKIRFQNLFMFNNGGSITIPYKRATYAKRTDDNPDGYQSSNRDNMIQILQGDWADQISVLFNNKEKVVDYDGNEYSYSDLDLYKDYDNPYVGYIDNITLIFKKSNKNLEIGWGDPLYTYQSTNNRFEYNLSNKYKLQSYNFVQCFTDYDTTYVGDDNINILSLGNIGHETTHSLGLLDLYSSTTNASGVGLFSSMGRRLTYVPQFITAKERDKMNWYDKENIKTIKTDGTYKINLTTDSYTNNVIAYKILYPETNREYYFEYRRFDSTLNRFDNFNATFSGNKAYSSSFNSGLAISMFDSSSSVLSNLNVKNNNWVYQILGGTNLSKNDAALNLSNPSLDIFNSDNGSKVNVTVLDINDTELTFKVSNLPAANVTNISFSNKPTSIKQDESVKLNLNLEGSKTSFAPISFKISKNTSLNTKVDDEGYLTIGNDENSPLITITASYSNISSSIDIAVTKAECNHPSLTFHQKVEPTCIKEGMKEYYQCNDCHKYFSDSHANYEVSYDSLILSKTSHTIVTTVGKDPTCLEDGYSERQVCSVCNTVILESHVINKLGHNPSSWIIDKEATTTTKGHKHIECLRCHEILQEEDIPKKSSSSSISSSISTSASSNSSSPNNNENNKKDNSKVLIISLSITFSLLAITFIIVAIYFVKKYKKTK